MRNKKQQTALTKIGDIISRKRLDLGYSRIKLAVELDTDEKQIRRIESGEVNPTIITLLKIFYVLNIDIGVLSKVKIDDSFLYD